MPVSRESMFWEAKQSPPAPREARCQRTTMNEEGTIVTLGFVIPSKKSLATFDGTLAAFQKLEREGTVLSPLETVKPGFTIPNAAQLSSTTTEAILLGRTNLRPPPKTSYLAYRPTEVPKRIASVRVVSADEAENAIESGSDDDLPDPDPPSSRDRGWNVRRRCVKNAKPTRTAATATLPTISKPSRETATSQKCPSSLVIPPCLRIGYQPPKEGTLFSISSSSSSNTTSSSSSSSDKESSSDSESSSINYTATKSPPKVKSTKPSKSTLARVYRTRRMLVTAMANRSLARPSLRDQPAIP